MQGNRPIGEQKSKALLNILQYGLLKIRKYAWEGNSEACAIEADHIHDIPAVLLSNHMDMLEHYLRIHVARYRSQVGADGILTFERFWNELEKHGPEKSA